MTQADSIIIPLMLLVLGLLALYHGRRVKHDANKRRAKALKTYATMTQANRRES
jgi:hypothetical protein